MFTINIKVNINKLTASLIVCNKTYRDKTNAIKSLVRDVVVETVHAK